VAHSLVKFRKEFEDRAIERQDEKRRKRGKGERREEKKKEPGRIPAIGTSPNILEYYFGSHQIPAMSPVQIATGWTRRGHIRQKRGRSISTIPAG